MAVKNKTSPHEKVLCTRRLQSVNPFYKKRDITLKIKDLLADIFNLSGDKKLSKIITSGTSTLSDKEVWQELEKCLQALFTKASNI